jgi:hypothetical protein
VELAFVDACRDPYSPQFEEDFANVFNVILKGFRVDE